MHSSRRIALARIIVCVVMVTGSCSKDPSVAKQEYLAKGNRYFDQHKYVEAIIEYRNALAKDNKFAAARYKLAQAYDQLGDGVNAQREYVNAADLMPTDADAQVRAGLFLAAGGRIEEAKDRAEKALALDPKHLEAQMLLAQTLGGLKDINSAITEVENAIRMAPGDERGYVQLGAFRQRQGNIAEAEKAFQQAVALDPKSMYATVGFAKFYLSMGRMKEAEEWVKKAIALSPDDFNANRTLAVLYLSTNRVAEAEAPLKAVARLSLSGTPRLVLADYYFLANRKDEARRVLDTFKNDPALFSEVRTRLSALEMADGHAKEANGYVDEVLKKSPNDPAAAVMKARYLISEGQLGPARALLKAAVTQAPLVAEAHYWLGVVSRALGDNDAARTALLEARRLAPTDIGTMLVLAQMNMTDSKLDAAMELLNEALTLKPGDVLARTARIDVLASQGKLPTALQEATSLTAANPALLAPVLQLGRIHMRLRDYAAAERDFQRAFQISAADPGAIGALVDAKIAAGKVAEARAFAEDQVAKNPKLTWLHLFAARAYKAAHDTSKAESALKDALAADPANLTAYMELTQIYIETNRLDDARAQLESIVEAQPKAVWPRTLIAMSLHLQQQKAEAKKRYEEILKIDPQAAIAANNLATIFEEEGQEADRALDLAQTAKRGLPDSAEVNDTLGLAYIGKGLANLALPPLELSVRKDPQNPVYRYHLGLAYSKLGQKDRARATLEKALAISADFEGSADAKRVLAALGR